MKKVSPVILLTLLVLVFAQQIVQEEKIEIFGTGIERYVKVIPKSNLSLLIPGYEYEVSMLISWDIPNFALAQIQGPRVDIFVEIESVNVTNTYFKRNKTISNIYRTILQCYVTNTACDNRSKLTEEVLLYLKVPHLGVKLSEHIKIRASALPFGDFEEVVEEQALLSNELNLLRQNVTRVANGTYSNVSQLVEIEERINETEAKIAQFELAEARRSIDELKVLLEKTGIQYSLLSKISYLEGKLTELSSNLTDAEREFYGEIVFLLNKAKEKVFSFDFATSDRLVADIEKRINTLENSISERKKTIVEKITSAFPEKIFGLDAYAFITLIVFVLILLLFLILRFARERG